MARDMETSGPSTLPVHLRAFLYSCIDSLEQLEILLLLRASTATWTTRAVAQAVQVADGRARVWLDALAARGLVRVTVRNETEYAFHPASDVLRRYCEELAEAYRQSQRDVLRFVAALPPSSIRSFANAFKLRDTE